MPVKITEETYQQEIRNFINLSVDRVNILYDSNLCIGGFSLIHILNDQKQMAKILGISGEVTYQGQGFSTQFNTRFGKNQSEGMQFFEEARKLKEVLMESKAKVQTIHFGQNSKSVELIFEDNSKLVVEADSDDSKPLSYDDDELGYTVVFESWGQSKTPTYYRISF